MSFVIFTASNKPENNSVRLQSHDPLLSYKAEQVTTNFFPPNSKRINLEIEEGLNHVINTVHRAYADHHSIALFPDQLWLLVLQGLTTQVRSNPQKYGPVFLKAVELDEKNNIVKTKIVVQRDDFILGASSNPWEEVFSEFRKKMNLHDQDVFAPNFSTSTETSIVACDVVMMDAMQDFFDYEFCSECGIPTMAFYGTVQDYKTLLDRVSSLAAKLDMNEWFAHFDYTMKKLIQFLIDNKSPEAFRFFEAFYKSSGGSGGPYVDGWINVFFPFLRDGSVNKAVDWYSKQKPWHGTEPIEFPTGVSIAPVKWVYHDVDHEYEFGSGMLGASIVDGFLTPTIGWFVRPKLLTK